MASIHGPANQASKSGHILELVCFGWKETKECKYQYGTSIDPTVTTWQASEGNYLPDTYMTVSIHCGVLRVGVLPLRALLFGVHIFGASHMHRKGCVRDEVGHLAESRLAADQVEGGSVYGGPKGLVHARTKARSPDHDQAILFHGPHGTILEDLWRPSCHGKITRALPQERGGELYKLSDGVWCGTWRLELQVRGTGHT